ncbi:MAG: hypothetical protein ACYC4Q_00785 [Victivallaceae bacterium]
MIKASRVVLICLHAAALLLLCGCSSPRPVLYPNKYYQQMGNEQVTRDIDAAIKAADERNMTHSNDGKEAVKTSVSSGISAGTVVGAGAAAGGGIGGGTAVSAAGAGASGLVHWMFSRGQPDPVFRGFVETYLKNKGYQVIGWQ